MNSDDIKLHHPANSQVVNDIENRGLDTKLDNRDEESLKISLMTIDETIVTYLNDIIQPTIEVNGVSRKVPVEYGNQERWSAFRKDGFIRELNTDKIQTPLILLRRTSMEKGQLSTPINKFLEVSYTTGWNRRNAYDKFAALNSVIPSKQFNVVMFPDYLILTYEVVVWTEQEEQMSDVIGQIKVDGDEYWGTRNDFKFRVSIDNFDNQSELEATSDRLVRTSFQMKANAYLIPERVIRNFHMTSTTKKLYTAKKAIVITEIDGTKVK